VGEIDSMNYKAADVCKGRMGVMPTVNKSRQAGKEDGQNTFFADVL